MPSTPDFYSSNLKILRQKLNMSQSALARAIGITPAMISLYESGKRKPSYQTVAKIVKIAKAYRIDINMEYIRTE